MFEKTRELGCVLFVCLNWGGRQLSSAQNTAETILSRHWYKKERTPLL